MTEPLTYAKPNHHKMEWCAKKQVMEMIIHHNGTLFGGAVRDWYIHDLFADKFYEAYEAKGATAEDIAIDVEDAYNDPTQFPEFIGRRILPRDIDATIDEKHVSTLLHNLRSKGLQVYQLFSRDAKRYIPNLMVEEGDIEHQAYTIQYLNLDFEKQLNRLFPSWVRNDRATHNFISETAESFRLAFGDRRADYTIYLDLLVRKRSFDARSLDAPYSKLDFECNALLMDSNGFRISNMLWPYVPSLMKPKNPLKYNQYLQRILERIEKRQAFLLNIPLEGTSSHALILKRIEKMLDRGWVIEGFESIQYHTDKNYEGHCLICHDDVPEKHYKMRCCDARFHTKCLVRAMTEGESAILNKRECVMCKTKFCLEDLQKDTSVLTRIHQFHHKIIGGASQVPQVPQVPPAPQVPQQAPLAPPQASLAPAPSGILPIVMAMSLDSANQIIRGLPNQPILGDWPSLPALEDDEEF